ncbi:vacuolar membrane-associated protein iml1 [Trapelia coarctata]|nr:vacuolar membrane-associated protein iml1 [Trapelia coarctata]
MSNWTLPKPSRPAFPTSQLRYVSARSPSDDGARASVRENISSPVHSDIDPQSPHITVVCSLGVHDEAFSTDDVLVSPSLFKPKKVPIGTPMRIVAPVADSPDSSSSFRRHGKGGRFGPPSRRSSARLQTKHALEASFMFKLKELPSEVTSRHPNLELSVSRRIAEALGFKHRSQVVLSKVEENDFVASHVEITFRDAYLTRADMWRLFVTELVDNSVYKGQKLLFMGTIKAQIRNIYMQGRKLQSAFCGTSTKPIFRSESARYVLFVQMSKEMWDFDVDGTGEIMFHKVINGFLPDLFRRWQDIGARHLVSIILFTRLEYERGFARGFEPHSQGDQDSSMSTWRDQTPYRDFYRVLVSDMASGQWAAILTQLKKEFKVFLHDVSIRSVRDEEIPCNGDDSPTEPNDIIAGRPMAAVQGNILEAINLASSQFSADYIDRDLVRTGLSIVVLTPGTGIFEVDRNLLAMTTDNLIENGISIDLVCLSRMPLHSVPLFKYRPNNEARAPESHANKEAPSHLSQVDASYHSNGDGPLVPELSLLGSSPQVTLTGEDTRVSEEWHYAIPHWVDVSFWTISPGLKPTLTTRTLPNSQQDLQAFSRRSFLPRVRMYEVQMMGIMENEMTSISIPQLSLFSAMFSSGRGEGSRHYPKPSMRRTRPRDTSISYTNPKTASSSLSASCSSVQTGIAQRYGSIFDCMDDYDDWVFRHPQHPRDRANHRQKAASITLDLQHRLSGKHRPLTSSASAQPAMNDHGRAEQQELDSVVKRPKFKQRNPSSKSTATQNSSQLAKAKVLSRQISFGLRGFGIAAPKTTPITEISAENAQYASLLSRGLQTQRLPSGSHSLILSDEASGKSSMVDLKSGQLSIRSVSDEGSDPEQRSKPIAIRAMKATTNKPASLIAVEDFARQEPSGSEEQITFNGSNENSHKHLTHVSQREAMAPWLTILNPSNPRNATSELLNRLGRWHHVFPRPISASSIKWKSLCSPASIPLTTENFPSQKQLRTEYSETEHTITAQKEKDPSEEDEPDAWLVRELIGARLCNGFQVVLGSGLASPDDTSIFSNGRLGHAGTKVVLSKGNTIHQLSVMKNGVVGVRQHIRRGRRMSFPSEEEPQTIAYTPAVRTTLGERYVPRKVVLSSPRQIYDWYRLDRFIAGHEKQQLGRYPEPLHFWRARFVLIPKERPSNRKRVPQMSSEDNEEEIRLEGIRKLTQLWQKNRYISPDERRFPNTMRRRKDTNPLDIIYRTRNLSAIVAAELIDTPLFEAEGADVKPTQLLPDNELLEREDLNLPSLASTIQGDRGIKMMDRRWHWRLHYNCFIGMELTTWLLNNFKDIESRDEAVDLGNELMKQGLFQHVERRHNFRDGNFFYQISPEYRVPREARGGWFGSRKLDRSAPSTPITEVVKSPGGMRSRSGSNGEDGSEGDPRTPTGRQSLGVALSKRLVYDVDPRKRSYRQELITLHYDQISSADDCYHLRIDWMNVTPKLIEDAIVHWATSAERNGLRLVELPISEASRINEFHPFRAPYIMKLAKTPPEKLPLTYFDATSLTAKPTSTSSFPYQKAILKKFDFVLDLEAAKDFPASVDVTYSWGRPDYRYPQYISRAGVLLVQITDDGEFVLLANRLYNHRSAGTTTKEPMKARASNELDNGTYRSPARGTVSPSGSPAIRATPDVGPGFASSDLITPERIANDLERFCHDVRVLEAFYDEVLEKSTASGPVTPFMQSSVPALGNPPAMHLDAIDEKIG